MYIIMRKLFTLASLFVAMAMASCMYDDTSVVNSISDLQQRVSTLEKLQSANDRGLLIESVTETAEGYIVKFTDGSEITLYHGTDGKDGVDGVDGKDGVDGTDGKDGANGDGACLLEDVVVTDEYVTFYLLDGNSFTFYFSTYKEAVGIVFDIEDGVACLAGASLEFGYTITGGYSDAAVECFGDGGWRARVINRSATAGTIKVTAPEAGGDGKVVVLVLSPAGGTCMKSILFDEGAIENIVDRYEAEWEACSLEVKFRTNLDYDVRIPAEAQSWISVAETRATMRDAAIVLAIDENEEGDPVRSAIVELVNDADDVLYSFEVCQKAQPTSEPIEFADKYAKLVCVQKYDKNGDGELSPKEAAEVTSIPSHFFGDYYQAVKSFDELKHFINLRTISNYAFSGCNNLKSVAIPKSVTSINYFAFSYCSSLESVYITDMSAWCGISFDDFVSNPLCYRANLYLNNELVTELTIPNDITKIRSYAFYMCGSITSVTIPNGVTAIDSYAFYSCENLTNVTLPNSVTSIGSDAFYGCKSLATATLPDSITSIGSSAFKGCESLESINIPQNLIKIDSDTFYGCKSLKSVVIPDGVISIGSRAFGDCSSMESATIGADVVSIDSYAFENCSSLKSVNFTSATAPVLGTNVFSGYHIGCVYRVQESAYTNFMNEPTWAGHTHLLRYEGIERPAESYAFGDIVTVDGSVGIVFYASEDIVYIMSVEEASTMWSTEHVDTYADDYTNGAYNTNVIKSIDGWEEKYPAFKWCADLGENWYLPAINELQAIDEVKDVLNATLSANGYTSLSGWYWSSTDNYDTYLFNFSNGNWNIGNKNNTNNVRAVVAL